MWSSIVISLRSWRSAGQQLCEVIVSSVLGVAGWSSTGRCTWSADGVGRLRKQSAWKLPLSRAPADQLFRLQAPPIHTCANSERALGSCWSLGRASTSGWSGSCTASTRTRPSSQPPSSTNVSPNPSHRSPLALSILLQLTCIVLFLPFSFIKLQPLHQPRRASFGLSRHRHRAYASRRIVGLSAHNNPAPQQIARRPSHPVRLSRCRYVSGLPYLLSPIRHRASSSSPRLVVCLSL